MWSDRETADDCLGFSRYVSVLAETCVEADIAPLTLGVFGSWGSGKTSLMQMLKARIESQSDPKKVKTLWFNAWRYEGREEAQSALIHAILAKLAEDKTIGQEAKELIKKLTRGASVLKLTQVIAKSVFTMTPDFEGFLGALGNESKEIAATMEQFEADFEDLLTEMAVERIVVFIDDLDRCQSEKVIETFETIKLFLNVPECTFVIGADAAKIDQAVADTYRIGDQDRDSFANDYLEKIIQLPFRIPEQQRQDILRYVGMLVLKRSLDTDGWDRLLGDRDGLFKDGQEESDAFNAWVLGHEQSLRGKKAQPVLTELQGILPHVDILASGLKGNPRQIKRFLNVLSLRQRLARSNKLKVSDSLLVKLVVLEYAWKKFFAAVVLGFDPNSGVSPLIARVMETARKGLAEDTESITVTAALQEPGLVAFLNGEPKLDNVDLTPYLFLAQTALGTQRIAALAPPDEAARDLVARIMSGDQQVAESAGRQAARRDVAIVQSVVKMVVPRLIASQDARVQTHALGALDHICSQHKPLYTDVVGALERVSFGKGSAAAMVAQTVIDNAQKATVTVSPEAIRRVAEAAPKVLKPLESKRRPSQGGER